MIKAITATVVFICMNNANIDGAVIAIGIGLLLSAILDDIRGKE